MLAFKVFNIVDTEAKYSKTVEIDPEEPKHANEIKSLFKLLGDKSVYVRPDDVNGINFIKAPRQRGRNPHPDKVIVFMHEQFVVHRKTVIQILVAIYREFDIEISSNQLNDVLSQKTYRHVPGIDDLREQAKELMPKKKDRRRKITDEWKEEWVELRKEGLSGCAIAKKYDVTPQSVNAYFRELRGLGELND